MEIENVKGFLIKMRENWVSYNMQEFVDEERLIIYI